MTIQSGSIQLRASQPSQEVRYQDVLFMFASGRFTYDCVRCNAKCCRGYGYGVEPGVPFQAQLSAAPAMWFFVEPVVAGKNDAYEVRNCPPGCFFLTGTGMCGIQAAHGYEAKPETCRLFPFNRFRRIGHNLLVTPHVGICPLEVLPAGRSSANSDHAQLLSIMGDHGIHMPIPDGVCGAGDVTRRLALEQQILENSEQYLEGRDYESFVAAQEIAGRQLDKDLDPDSPQGGAVPSEFYILLEQVLGTSPEVKHRRDAALVRTLTASTPFLRTELLFPLSTAPRDHALHPAQVPDFLRALHWFAAFAQEAGLADVSFQALTTMFTDHRPLLTLLAHINVEMEWRPGDPVDASSKSTSEFQVRYLRIAEALLPSSRWVQKPLGQLLIEHIDFEGLRRIDFLRFIARRLMGRIVPVTRKLGTRRRTLDCRRALQRLTVRTMRAKEPGAAKGG
jgi:Fe-S-cluster containining protein